MTIRGLAHRGYPLKHPENTLRGFEAAIELGFTHFELDVHMSKDGIPVVIHDSTVNRTTNGAGAVKDYTVEELRELDANIELGLIMYGATPAIFPYMKEINAQYLSIKYTFLTPKVVAEAKAHNIQLIAWTPDDENMLQALKDAYPDVLICTNNLEGWVNVCAVGQH